MRHLGAALVRLVFTREREIASWISMAAKGARIAVARSAIGVRALAVVARPPIPKILADQRAILAITITAEAMVAATELIRMSGCGRAPVRAPGLPSSSSRLRSRMIPCVTATAACCGLRPVAEAFGASSGKHVRRAAWGCRRGR